MATFDTDPSTPLSVRALAFADTLESEGRKGAAAAVKQAVYEYRSLLAAGRPLDALVSLHTAAHGVERRHSHGEMAR